MIKAVENTKHYFQAPGNYFWRWAEDTAVIEWNNGTTICYRNDLINILKELSEQGVPPMGSLLLVLHACLNEPKTPERFMLERVMSSFNDKSIESLFESAFSFLKIINALPPELRTGRKRIHLIREIFETTNFVFARPQFKDSLDELNSGRLDAMISEKGKDINVSYFISDLQYLSMALMRFPDTQSLEQKLRTGLKEIPAAATVEIVPPETAPADLLDQLSLDPQTSGIARLARRLASVIHIPLHSQGSGGQSYGGISDITNRGNYDRLLLSELAQDDLLMTARLVNNEALYFRREEPPENPKRTRIILLDVTLKMWGIPRVFALSSALAFARGCKHGEQVEAYLLKGDLYQQVSLADKAGVIKALETLHHALHCGKALELIIKDLPASEQNEYVLITENRQLNDPSFHSAYARVRDQLSFIITVSRNGEFRFAECVKAGTKVLNEAKLGIQELLKEPVQVARSQQPKSDNFAVCEFLSRRPLPLLLPKRRIELYNERITVNEEVGVITIGTNQRVFLLTSRDKGGNEILKFIENGTYFFGWTKPRTCLILVHESQKQLLKLYVLDLAHYSVQSVDLSFEMPEFQRAGFWEDSLYVNTNLASFRYDYKSFEVKEKRERGAFSEEIDAYDTNRKRHAGPELRSAKNFLDGPSVNTLFKAKQLFINKNGLICIGQFLLALNTNGMQIDFLNNESRNSAHLFADKERNGFFSGTKIKYRQKEWRDGTKAIIDKRGLLHLISSDPKLPEVTILLVTGESVACWASDEAVCGQDFFIHLGSPNRISPQEFYLEYIQPIIDRILSHAPSTSI